MGKDADKSGWRLCGGGSAYENRAGGSRPSPTGEFEGKRILRRASLAQDDSGDGKAGASVCHSARSTMLRMTEETWGLVLLHVILSGASVDAESKNPFSFGSAYGIRQSLSHA